jgi:hypothetical protein
VKFVTTEAAEDSRFVDETRLPLARMRFEHELDDAPEGSGTLVTHRVVFSGLLAPLWARVIGRGIARELPATVRTLASRAA